MPTPVAVPDVDGVPPVAFAPGFAAGILLATGDAADLGAAAGLSAPWGLYRNGQPVVIADTVAAFDHKSEWVISDYPLERGRFESFNKVKLPYDVRLVFTAGGSQSNRAALLSSIAAIEGDLNLYDAVTPEKVNRNLNVIRQDHRRTAQSGVGLLTVSVICQEVRVATTSADGGSSGDSAAPSGASQTNDGSVQTTSDDSRYYSPGADSAAYDASQAGGSGGNFPGSEGDAGYTAPGTTTSAGEAGGYFPGSDGDAGVGGESDPKAGGSGVATDGGGNVVPSYSPYNPYIM